MKMFPMAAAALVLAGWSFLAASADEPSGAPELTEGVDYVCVTHDGGAGAYEAFPDVVRLKDGRLFCVFYDGYGHVGTKQSRNNKLIR